MNKTIILLFIPIFIIHFITIGCSKKNALIVGNYKVPDYATGIDYGNAPNNFKSYYRKSLFENNKQNLFDESNHIIFFLGHLYSTNISDDFDEYLKHIKRISPESIVILGDSGYTDFVKNCILALKNETPKIYHTPGNSDFPANDNFLDNFENPPFVKIFGKFKLLVINTMVCPYNLNKEESVPHQGCYFAKEQIQFIKNEISSTITNNNLNGLIIATHHLFWVKSFKDKYSCEKIAINKESPEVCKAISKACKNKRQRRKCPWNDVTLSNSWVDDFHPLLKKVIVSNKQAVLIGGDTSFNGGFTFDGVQYISTGHNPYTWPDGKITFDYTYLKLRDKVEIYLGRIERNMKK